MAKKNLREIIKERITNLYLTAHELEKSNKPNGSFVGKAELLESILDEFDGKIEPL
jgi:hypothetical protein